MPIVFRHNLQGKFKLFTALICCLVFFLAPGCTQKVGWRPPDEPTLKTPPPEPPPRVEYQLFYVAADRLNLRACPGMDCPKIATLNRNQEVEKVGESQGWYQVRSRHDGTLGWVDARYLAGAPIPESAVLPTETPQPKATKPEEPRPEPSIKAKTPTPVAGEEEDPAQQRKRQRVPEAQAAEPPAKPEAAPAPETPTTPPPTTPSEPAKKKIRIM